MFKRNRSVVIAAAALLGLGLVAAQHPRADIRILTHRAGDLTPQRVQAMVDIGLASVSVLVTWSDHLRY